MRPPALSQQDEVRAKFARYAENTMPESYFLLTEEEVREHVEISRWLENSKESLRGRVVGEPVK